MSKVNQNFIKAGLYELISSNKDVLVDRLSYYLKDKIGVLDYITDGPIPITSEIKEKIEEYIKKDIPVPEYFGSITSIDVSFDYLFNQQYHVVCKVSRFYNSEGQPWKGYPVASDDYTIEKLTEMEINILPDKLNNNN